MFYYVGTVIHENCYLLCCYICVVWYILKMQQEFLLYFKFVIWCNGKIHRLGPPSSWSMRTCRPCQTWRCPGERWCPDVPRPSRHRTLLWSLTIGTRLSGGKVMWGVCMERAGNNFLQNLYSHRFNTTTETEDDAMLSVIKAWTTVAYLVYIR